MALNNVPLTGQTLGVTRVPINQNFSVIDQAFSQDHVDFNLPGQGKHDQVTFPSQSSAPTFLATEIGLFNQNASPTGINDIWMARGTAAAFPITGYKTVGVGATNGWTYLPSGLKIAWGTGSMSAPTVQQNVVYATALVGTNFPGFTTFWTAPQLTRLAGGPAPISNFVCVQSYAQTQFTVIASTASNTGTIQFSWMVIGL
jgi:hypothetical protein